MFTEATILTPGDALTCTIFSTNTSCSFRAARLPQFLFDVVVGCDFHFTEVGDLVQQLVAQTASSLKVLKADLHELIESKHDQWGEGGTRVLFAPLEDNDDSSVLEELELEHVSEQCLKDILYSRFPRGLKRLSLFGDANVQHLELSDKVDWKRRLSLKYPAAEVTLQDNRMIQGA